MMNLHAEPGAGKVVTFYSYKGGTGRSMALANVACLLARRTASGGRGVLAIDWDLEAPGLHRYLVRPGTDHEPGQPGLIELFTALSEAAPTETPPGPGAAEAAAAEALARVDLEEFVTPTSFSGLSFMPAGRFDDSYSARVTGFDWNALHQRTSGLIPAFAHRLAELYAWVLIDSRTGISDTSGICTMLMPELLVVVFTPNLQSLTGLVELVRKAADYRRRRSNDVRPLVVFPLPSRIEPARPALLERWRLGRAQDGLEGYQRQFEMLFAEVYALPDCDLTEYFDEVQVQHAPDFAYGEQIAVQIEESGTRLSLRRSYETFTDRLVNVPGPWVDPKVAGVERDVEELRARGMAALEGGDPKQAQALLLRAADLHQETTAARSPDLAATLLRLGSQLLDAGELADAEIVLRRAVETARRVFGSDDLEVVRYVHRLADAVAEAGREEEAFEPVRQTVRVLTDTLGGDNAKVADAYERLGKLLLGAYRRSTEAKERAQHTIEIRPESPPLDADQRLPEAEEAFQRSLEIRERLPDAADAPLADSLERLAEIAIESGRLDSARRYLDRALPLSGKGRPEQRARVLNRLGQLDSRMGRLDEAERWFQEAVQLGHAKGEVARATVADSQDGLAEIARAQGDHDRALALYEDAHLAREEQFGPAHPSTLRSVLHLADLAMDEAEWDRAAQQYRRVLSLLARSEMAEHPLALEAALKLGALALRRDDLEEAQDRSSRALEISRSLGDRVGMADASHLLGRVAEARGDYDKALDWSHRALEISESLGDPVRMAAFYHQLGRIARIQGNYEQALEWHGRSLAISEALGDRVGMAVSYRELGDAAMARGDYDQALSWLRQALEISEALGDPVGMARSYLALSRLALVRDDQEQALNWSSRALESSQSLGDSAGMAASYHQLGNLAQAQGENEQALEWHGKSLAISQSTGDRAGMAASYHQFGEIVNEQGDFDRALDFYRRALDLYEELGDRTGIAAVRRQIDLLPRE